MEQIKESIYKNLSLSPDTQFAPKWGSKPSITLGELLDALFLTHSSPKAMALLGRSEKTFITNIKKLFPNVKLNGGGESWEHWFIKQSDYKKCTGCKQFKLKHSYGKDASSHDGLASKCRECVQITNRFWYENNKDYHVSYLNKHRAEYNARAAKRRALLLQRTVKWADLEEIRQFYINCPEGYHVDHYYPLQGATVCGLHVIENLQYLTAKDNMSKGNSMPV